MTSRPTIVYDSIDMIKLEAEARQMRADVTRRAFVKVGRWMSARFRAAPVAPRTARA